MSYSLKIGDRIRCVYTDPIFIVKPKVGYVFEIIEINPIGTHLLYVCKEIEPGRFMQPTLTSKLHTLDGMVGMLPDDYWKLFELE